MRGQSQTHLPTATSLASTTSELCGSGGSPQGPAGYGFYMNVRGSAEPKIDNSVLPTPVIFFPGKGVAGEYYVSALLPTRLGERLVYGIHC